MSMTIPLSQSGYLADTRLAQVNLALSGVGLVTIVGGQKPACSIQGQIDPKPAYGLNLEDLRGALQATSIDQAKEILTARSFLIKSTRTIS